MARTRAEQNEVNRLKAAERRRSRGANTQEQIKDARYLEFVSKAILIHGMKYDYSVPEIITCPLHGPFKQTRPAHLRGQGCPKCGAMARVEANQARATEARNLFVSKATAVHGSLYSYDDVQYHNVHKKVSISCGSHGTFEQTPAAHLQGQGCPCCANERRAAFAESKGESLIAQWLDSHNIPYVKQKMFDDCRDRLPLRFDFYLPNHQMLIEFDGQQHFEFVKRFHGTVDRFIESQTRDAIKQEYADRNCIPLLRIKYSQEKDIDKILDKRILV